MSPQINWDRIFGVPVLETFSLSLSLLPNFLSLSLSLFPLPRGFWSPHEGEFPNSTLAIPVGSPQTPQAMVCFGPEPPPATGHAWPVGHFFWGEWCLEANYNSRGSPLNSKNCPSFPFLPGPVLWKYPFASSHCQTHSITSSMELLPDSSVATPAFLGQKCWP